MPMTMKRYSEMKTLLTFEERYAYLQLHGVVGEDTFGFDRIFNQKFYRSREWKRVREIVILRDNACDLGIEERPICGRILIHHMNPIQIDDLKNGTDILLDPEFLICVTHETHNAIHYGDDIQMHSMLVERKHGDTCPWRVV